MTDSDLILYISLICFYLVPMALIISSKKTRGQNKNYWLLATLFTSWLGWVAYISVGEPPKKQSKKK